MMTTFPRPTANELAEIRRAYAKNRAGKCPWMAGIQVGMLLAEIDALNVENAALQQRLRRQVDQKEAAR